MWKSLLFLFLSGEQSVIGLGKAWGNFVISGENLRSPVYNRTNDLYSSSLDFLSRSFDAVVLFFWGSGIGSKVGRLCFYNKRHAELAKKENGAEQVCSTPRRIPLH
jgi:hypothetical protein